ncbi:MAG: hypothetical protein GKR87_04305 [Kiritimatiellae bacterium]|nr:hypothetical protein [Kiritimatiellia bacterium]
MLANPQVGATISFSNADSAKRNRLINFIKNSRAETFTFILTANTDEGQETGWEFASKENKKYAAPMLSWKIGE